MTKLNQIIAVEKGVKADATAAVTSVYHRLQKLALLSGISRSYRPKDDDGDRLPSESTLVQYTVQDAIGEIRRAMERLFDVVATKDVTNTTAVADVVVDGNTLLRDVPATHLLWLEAKLVDLHTLIRSLPTLDPSENWHWDDAVAAFATDPTETTRTKKVPRNHVLAPATDRHPAQVQVYQEDVVVGYWTTTKFSGAERQVTVNIMLDRVRKLQDAVKQAREAANSTQIFPRDGEGAIVLDYVFSGLFTTP